MAESVPVRCPGCRREHSYSPPTYPCPCGASVTLPVLAGGVPVRVEHRTWDGSWTQVRCAACGRLDDWPQPEFGCTCGTTVRLAVTPADPAVARAEPLTPDVRPPGLRHDAGTERPTPRTVRGGGTGGGPNAGLPAAADRTGAARGGPPRRPAFRPVTIRTAQDARMAGAQYLRWLGYPDVKVAGNRPASGVDLRGPGVLAHVDPSTSLTALRAIETLWLNGLNEAARAVCFSLAGYARDARTRADELALPLFVLDLTGSPQPVNPAAEDLVRRTP